MMNRFMQAAGELAQLSATSIKLRLDGWYGALSERDRKRLKQSLTISFHILIFAVLFSQLRKTDWNAVFQSLPVSPWFYIFFLARYLLLPFVETLIYGVIWVRNLFPSFGVFLKKRALNFAVGGQSGDVWFVFWAADRLDIRRRDAFSAVKDVTLLSAAASNVVAASFLAYYAALGDRAALAAAGENILFWISAIVGVGLLISAVVLWFRGGLIRLSRQKARFAAGAHAGRSLINLVLLAAQWSAGIPEVVLTAWLNLLIIDLLIGRVPFIPGKDLFFLSVALLLASSIDAPEASVTALFLVNAALSQFSNAVTFMLGSIWSGAVDQQSDGQGAEIER